ncbi:MAG: hypothetical protein ACLR23_13490 [Clostridia bacterium]
MLNQAQDLRDQAARIDISRAVNYLLAKKPLLGDDTGLFDIQLAKLYIALDDRETARSYIHKVIDRNNEIREDSPIKKPLLDVVDAYNQLGQDETSPLLSSSVNKLVVAESQGVITVAEGNINGELSNYITSTLKYDRIFRTYRQNRHLAVPNDPRLRQCQRDERKDVWACQRFQREGF